MIRNIFRILAGIVLFSIIAGLPITMFTLMVMESDPSISLINAIVMSIIIVCIVIAVAVIIIGLTIFVIDG